MKKVLCVDWGNVLIEFDGGRVGRLLKRGRKEILLRDFVKKHDADLISAFDFYEGLKAGGHFRKEIQWTEFAYAYSQCLSDINWTMFYALKDLKKTGRARLVAITDNNHFSFNLTALLFPLAVDLFIENGREQIVSSHQKNINCLKRGFAPFVRACDIFKFSPDEAAFVDDQKYNLEAAVTSGFDRDACFLYKLGSRRNHAQFEKFLDKHFPAES